MQIDGVKIEEVCDFLDSNINLESLSIDKKNVEIFFYNKSNFSKISNVYKKIKINGAILVKNQENMIINSIIVLAGGIVFGINKVLYAIIILFIQKNVSDRIVLGISKNKTIIIVSSKYDEISKYLNNELKHDVTIFNTKGKYTNTKQKTIMSVIPTKEYIIIKEIIKDIDKNAFVIVCDSYETRNQDRLLKNVKNVKSI